MRKEVIYDDLTGQQIDDTDLQTVDVLFAGYTGTFEGTADSVKALTELFASKDSTRLRELLGATMLTITPKAPPKAASRTRASGDHSAHHARQWCATEAGQAAVKRLGVSVPAKGKMPAALIQAWRESQA